jgi:hypothetical protein
MPDRLVPRDSRTYLSPLGVVNRLKSAFAYVESDVDEGRRHALELIGRARGNIWSRYVNREYVEQLEAGKDRALYVCFGDDPGSELSLLSAYIIPGMPLDFEYSSRAHEEAVQPLLSRCATVLGYDIVKDRRAINDPAFHGRERRSITDRRSLKDRRKSA